MKINPSNDILHKYIQIKNKTIWTSDEMKILEEVEKLLPFIVMELLEWREKEM